MVKVITPTVMATTLVMEVVVVLFLPVTDPFSGFGRIRNSYEFHFLGLVTVISGLEIGTNARINKCGVGFRIIFLK